MKNKTIFLETRVFLLSLDSDFAVLIGFVFVHFLITYTICAYFCGFVFKLINNKDIRLSIKLDFVSVW